MNKEEAAKYLIDISYALGNTSVEYLTEKDGNKMREAIDILKQEPKVGGMTKEEEAIEKLKKILKEITEPNHFSLYTVSSNDADIFKLAIEALTQTKVRRCEDCKYFELDSWMNVNGIPLIVAHNICKRWGDGCKTKADGYCFMFESKDGEER